MKIAIIGTRGIPNDYGGFEQFATFLSAGLAARGHEVTVYCPHYHSYQQPDYQGVRLKHVYSPEQWMGSSAGSFFYDYACLRDALRKEHFDIIYETGYTSIVPAYVWFNVKAIRRPVIVTNMDGLEYKRAKFSPWVQKFLLWEERMTVKYSRHLISDNLGIQDYYKEKYGRDSQFLAYGADVPASFSEAVLRDYGLTAGGYLLIVARLEPENNIYMAIEGYLASSLRDKLPLVIVGKTDTPYMRHLAATYGAYEHVRFLGGIYDADRLNAVRHFSRAYFHGHSVGGTNPSLLEAMAAGCFILAHDNVFNRTVLGDNALFYNNEGDVAALLNSLDSLADAHREPFTRENIRVISEKYSWAKLTEDYEAYFRQLLEADD